MKIKSVIGTQNSNGVYLDKNSSIEMLDYPIFCLRHIHKDYSIEKCLKADKAFSKQFLKKIGEISSLSWSEIKLAPRSGTGSEKIDKKSIHAPIPTTYTDDVDFFISFYFNGKKGRIVGHRNKSLFHILYIDTDLSVYSH